MPSIFNPAMLWAFLHSLYENRDSVGNLNFLQGGNNAEIRTSQNKIREQINIDDFAGTDAEKIQAAATYAGSLGVGVIRISRDCSIDTPIIVPINVSWIQDGTITYTGSHDAPAITFGNDLQSNRYIYIRNLNIRSSIQSDWSDEEYVGVKLINLQRSKITIIRSEGFTIGLQSVGISNSGNVGFVYNILEIGYLTNNKVALDIIGLGTGGFTNQNTFIGGNYQVISGTGTGLSRYGIRMDGTTFRADNNVFLNPSIQLLASAATPGEGIPILMLKAAQNKIIGARSETNTTIFARVENDSRENQFDIMFGNTIDTIDDISTNPSSVITTGRNYPAVFNNTTPVFSINFADAVNRPSAAGLYVRNCIMYQTNGTILSIDSSGSNVNTDGNSINVDSARIIGIELWVPGSRTFVVNVGQSADIYIRCYDVNGNILSGSSPLYATGLSFATLATHSSFSGYRRTSTTVMYAKVRTEVVRVFIGVSNCSACRGFSVNISGDYANCSLPKMLIPRNLQLHSDVSPTRGPFDTQSWNRGTQQQNRSPSAGSAQGWTCVSQVNTTLTAGEPSGETVMAVDSTTGMTTGDICGVRQDNGTTLWTTLTVDSGTQITLATALTADAAAGNAVLTNRWRAQANIS